MDFAYSEEQQELRAAVRAFLDQKSDEQVVRRLMETVDGYDVAVWKQMADQLGLHGLAIPVEYGGAGYSFVELAIVLEEMGRRLLPAPFFSTAVLAASALLSSGDDIAKKAYLPAIASGQIIATIALTEDAGRWDERSIAAVATEGIGGWAVTGSKCFVLDGHVANLILVFARTDSGVSLFAVNRGATGLTNSPMTTIDTTRKLARLTFQDVPGVLIGSEGEGWAIAQRTLDLTATALASEQVGGAQFVLDMAVQYAKERIQFGRPIGSFQAIKHKCADLLVEVESARSAAQYAAWCAAELNEEFPAAAAMAKAYCSDAYFHAASENIQIHGGMGFTWEHPAHLYFKRAKSSELLFGDPNCWRELLAQRIGI